MTKYQPLEKLLSRRSVSHIPMTFADIEAVIADRLPASARKHRAWWSNNPSNSVITYAWLAAGYRTSRVDLEAESLVFVRDRADIEKSYPARRHPVFGCMKGIGSLEDGVDLTEPSDSGWGGSPDAVSR